MRVLYIKSPVGLEEILARKDSFGGLKIEFKPNLSTDDLKRTFGHQKSSAIKILFQCLNVAVLKRRLILGGGSSFERI